MAKRKGYKMNQKNQKNLIALGSAAVGTAAVVLSTHGAWKVPAVAATDTYAKFHDHIGDFINFLGVNNGVLIMVGIVGLGLAALLYRK